MSCATILVILGTFFFADDKPQQSAEEKPAIEKQADEKTDDSKVTDTKFAEKPAPKNPKASEPELRNQLLERFKEDQAPREAIVELDKKWNVFSNETLAKLNKEDRAIYQKAIDRMVEVDAENTKWLKTIVEKDGWPTISMVGKDGANAAWHLVQHADEEPLFQRQCLDLMEKCPKGEVSKRNIAYLTDRVLLKEKKKQIYGTQFITTSDGKMEPRPIEDEENVDIRRKEVGLGPIKKYAEQLNEVYLPSTKK
jgi:hypothetical protein